MNCRGFEEKILNYIDGELPAKEMQAMQEHQASCSHCAALLEQVKGTYNAFNDELDIDLPDAESFADEVLERYEKSQSPALYSLIRKTIAVAASVILMAGMAAGIIAGTSIAKTSGTTEETDYFSALASDFHLNTDDDVSFESYLMEQEANGNQP